MPLYDFKCERCGEPFEARVPYGEQPSCPRCGAERAERLITTFRGPLTIQPRGLEARRVEGARRAREEKRREASERRRAARATSGEPRSKPNGRGGQGGRGGQAA
jgi:putative FmdB family regulatory protein